MSLFPCPECGHSCSTKAVSCPSCGLPFDQTPRNERPFSSSETNHTQGASSIASGSPNSIVKLRGWGKSTLKVLLGIALLLGVLTVKALFDNMSRRDILTDQTASKLAEDNPYLSKADIVLLGNETIKRGLNTDQGKRFTFETFGRGIKLLSADEQEEIESIREQLFSTFSTEETLRVDSTYSKMEAGQSTTAEEVEDIRQLQKKAFNSLPESAKSRYQILMGKALKAALNTH